MNETDDFFFAFQNEAKQVVLCVCLAVKCCGFGENVAGYGEARRVVK